MALLVSVSAPPADFERQSGWVRTALQNAFHHALFQRSCPELSLIHI